MFKKHRITAFVFAMLATVQFASAANDDATPTPDFCFSTEDFSMTAEDDGLFFTAVPNSNIASIRYKDRTIQAGDAVTASMLNEMVLETSCVTDQVAVVEYYTINDGKISGMKSLKMSISPKKNEPPTAAPSSFETYRNIANTGKLSAADPEGAALTYSIVDKPKRGSVELHEDGTFTYTPAKNKVGSDSFSYSVTDNAGNTSNTAKVSVKIKKPTDKTTYADMAQDPDQFIAMWLKDKGIYSGSQIAGHFCFSPEQEVTRGEFLVMVMKLVGAEDNLTSMTSGFADEYSTPQWMRPYITSALANGMISGTNSDNGLVFRPTEVMEKAEAAVMIQNILSLPTTVMTSEYDDDMPAWAAASFHALSEVGINLDLSSPDDVLTRREAAKLLYNINQLIESETVSAFYWLQ